MASSLSLLLSAAALGAALLCPDGRVELPWLLLGSVLRLEATSRVFLALAGLVWTAAGLHARSYVAAERRRGFGVWWAGALAGNLLLVLAGDAATFYTGFALMSFASYGLVVHDRTPAAVRAGRIYLALVVAGEIAVFAALALGARGAGGDLRFEAIAAAMATSPHRTLFLSMVLLGFGVKAGALGLHVWLPLAHAEAPTPASAVLSAVMVKAGLLGWLLLVPPAAAPGLARTVLVAGLAAAFFGVVIGLTQQHPKVVLAYSTVSQMGLLTAGLSAALAGPASHAAAPAVLAAYALHHGVSKGALFLGAGVARGGGRAGRAAVPLLALPALALAAAPFTSGDAAKGGIKALLAASGGDAAVTVLLSLSSAGTAMVMVHLLAVLRREAAAAAPGHEAAPGEVLAFAALVAAAVALPVVLGAPPAAGALKGLWPVALGAALAVTFRAFPAPAIPPGDVLGLLAPRLARLRSVLAPGPAAPAAASSAEAPWLERALAWTGDAEARLGRLAGRGALLAALVAALHLLL